MTDIRVPEGHTFVFAQKPMVESSNQAAKMKKYRDWSAYPLFLSDCAKAAAADVLVTPPVAAAILGYSRVRMSRLLDQEEIISWAWFEPGKFHASEIFVSVQSLVTFGLKRRRLGEYDSEIPLQAVLKRSLYESLRRGWDS